MKKLDLHTDDLLDVRALRAKADLIAECRLLKAGKRLCVGEVTIHSDAHDEPVAHVTGTYSIPPR